jgi:hypothetical protein
MQTRLKELQDEKDELYLLFARGLIDVPNYLDKLDELNDEIIKILKEEQNGKK